MIGIVGRSCIGNQYYGCRRGTPLAVEGIFQCIALAGGRHTGVGIHLVFAHRSGGLGQRTRARSGPCESGRAVRSPAPSPASSGCVPGIALAVWLATNVSEQSDTRVL